MLPFRRRPPTFSTNELKARLQQQVESKDEILSGGGLVQRAIEQDLLELRPRFLEQLNQVSSPPYRHVTEGDAFQSFKHVFRQAKVALLHTRTIPARCDRASYVQLLYASCLSLLKRSFEEDNGNMMLTRIMAFDHAVFAVFCLYALKETNPLPVEPASPLQALPMGLRHADNARLLYRRVYASPIRIDRHHYSLLQRLRDEALARRNDCQARRMHWMSRLAVSVDAFASNEAPAPLDWTCTCQGTLDLVQVLDRLMPNLDFVEYTGPAGLEALAGHADYLYGCVLPEKTHCAMSSSPVNTDAVPESTIPKPLSDNELDAIVAAGHELHPRSGEHSEETTKEYKSRLNAIRQIVTLNAVDSNQAARVRDALKPIFDSRSEVSTNNNNVGNPLFDEAEASINVSSRNEESELPIGSVQDKGPVDDNAPPPKSPKSSLAELGLEVVLPSELTGVQREAIHAALNSAIEIGDSLIECTDETSAGVLSPPSMEVNFSKAGEAQNSNESDSSDTSSHSSGEGAAAITRLLSKVSAGSRAVKGGRVDAATETRNRQNAATALLRKDFLTMNLESKSNSSHDSSISSGGSDVDGIECEPLWTVVGEKGLPCRRRRARRKGRPSSAGKGIHKRSRWNYQEGLASARKRPRAGIEDSESSGEDESSVDIGLASLQTLLSSVQDDSEAPTSGQQLPTTRRHGTALSSGVRKQKDARSRQMRPAKVTKRTPNDEGHSSESSIASDASSVDIGKAALQTLFSLVGDEGNGGPTHCHQHPTAEQSRRERLLSGVRKQGDDRSRPLRPAPARKWHPRADDGLSNDSLEKSEASSDDESWASIQKLSSLVHLDDGERKHPQNCQTKIHTRRRSERRRPPEKDMLPRVTKPSMTAHLTRTSDEPPSMSSEDSVDEIAHENFASQRHEPEVRKQRPVSTRNDFALSTLGESGSSDARFCNVQERREGNANSLQAHHTSSDNSSDAGMAELDVLLSLASCRR